MYIKVNTGTLVFELLLDLTDEEKVAIKWLLTYLYISAFDNVVLLPKPRPIKKNLLNYEILFLVARNIIKKNPFYRPWHADYYLRI